MNPITLWYRWDAFLGDWDYNHFSSGHTDTPLPVPVAGQKWSGRWEHKHAWLTDDRPTPKIVWYGPEESV